MSTPSPSRLTATVHPATCPPRGSAEMSAWLRLGAPYVAATGKPTDIFRIAASMRLMGPVTISVAIRR